MKGTSLDQASLEASLQGLPVGPVRYYNQVGSTNDEAARWADAGAPDLAVVLADEQTAGKGRSGRSWYTPPGAALAFTLVLRPLFANSEAKGLVELLPRLSALGALAVTQALSNLYHLPAAIKWPNDVLVSGKKVCGILVEVQWEGQNPSAVLIGIGINIAASSVDEAVLPPSRLVYPAGYLEMFTGQPVARLELLHAILSALIAWRERLASPDFIKSWEERLAFMGEWVQLIPDATQSGSQDRLEGQVIGLAADGSLRLRLASGKIENARFGDLRLRPVDRT